MVTGDNVVDLLIAARAEHSIERSKQLLEAAIRACESLKESVYKVQAALTKAQAFAELALQEVSPQNRTTQWRNALDALESQWKVSPNPEIAEMYGSLAVDCFQ